MFFFLFLFLAACDEGVGDQIDRDIDLKSDDVIGQKGPDFSLSRRNVEPKEICYNFHRCRNACNEIYSEVSESGRCLNFSVSDVEDIYRTAFALQSPLNRNLRRIDSFSFAVFLSAGTETFNTFIYNYTIPEARRVLAWIAEDRDISEVLFRMGAGEFRDIFLNLFGSTNPSAYEYALHTSLKQGNTFYEISNDQNNDYAVYMAHRVIEDELCYPINDYASFDVYDFNEACVLRVYCHDSGRGRYEHQDDFPFISRVIRYDSVFSYIEEEDEDAGLGFSGAREITPQICNRVCFGNSCS